MTQRWLRIAHRGASGTAPEHTRAAFERAVQLGVDMIELDVQLSRDDRLVVMHDHQLQRTTSGTGLVRAHRLSELKGLDAGRWFDTSFAGQRVLTLEEVIELVGPQTRLNVELKPGDGDRAALAAVLAPVLRRAQLHDSVIVSCFDPLALRALREQDAAVPLAVLWQQPDFSEAWRIAAELNAVSIHPYYALVSADLVSAAHERQLAVLTWTVNRLEDMRELLQLGVDGLISDFPERFAQLTV